MTNKCIVWTSDFVLPIVSVGVGETIELLEEDGKRLGGCVVFIIV